MNRPMDGADLQDELAPSSYAAWFDSDLGQRVWRDERRALERAMGEVAGRRVLDVGAGEGRFARELVLRGARVVALDRSEAMLRAGGITREGLHPEPVMGDALELPFADESFDVVVAVTVLCLLDGAGDAARELARVTRPGGRVVLGELGRWSTWALARRGEALLKGGLWSTVRFRTAPELRKILADAGLQPGDVHGAVFYPRSALAARLLGRVDPWLGQRTTVGAAFLAVGSAKPSPQATAPRGRARLGRHD